MPSLEVTVICCKGLMEQKFDVIDPYVVLKLGDQPHKTAVMKNSGKDADFNEVFHFDVKGPPYALEVEVWDKDRADPDDPLGKATIDFSVALETGFLSGAFPLVYIPEVDNGDIMLDIKYIK